MNDAALSVLRTAFDTANSWAGISALIVAAGVFIELIVLFVFSKEIGKTEKSLLIFATALIVLGVVGEWWFGGEAATASETLQADAETKAANAMQAAGQANERATEFEKDAAELQSSAANAQKDAASAKERTASLEKEAAEANERAAVIMKETAWRQFTPKQISDLTSSLQTQSGKLVFAWIANDPESLSLALQFANLLASFPGKPWDMVNSAKVYPVNLVWGIRIPDVPAATPTVQILRDAFIHAGIAFSNEALPQEPMSFGASDPTVLAGRAIVLFGSRRPTFTQPPD
jgi:hypothetical protein